MGARGAVLIHTSSRQLLRSYVDRPTLGLYLHGRQAIGPQAQTDAPAYSVRGSFLLGARRREVMRMGSTAAAVAGQVARPPTHACIGICSSTCSSVHGHHPFRLQHTQLSRPGASLGRSSLTAF